MKKYRVKQVGGVFYPQKKSFFSWWGLTETITCDGEFINSGCVSTTLDEALEYIKKDKSGANHQTEIIHNIPPSVDLPDFKTCKKCSEVKLAQHFRRHLYSGDGLSSRCKACLSIDGAIYRQNNKESIAASDKKYRQDNREVIAAKVQAKRLSYMAITYNA